MNFFFDLGSLFGALGNIFSTLLSALAAAVTYLFGLIQAIAVWLYNLIVTVVQAIARAIAAIVKGFVHVISDIIHGRFSELLHDYQQFKQWLQNILGPIIRFLQKLQQLYNRYVLHYLLLVISIIQRLRQFLAVLRIFHVGWAAKLDGFLASVEQKIVQAVQVIQKTINELITTLDIIIDPSLIIRSHALGASILGSFASMRQILGFGSVRGLSGWEQQRQQEDSHALDSTTSLKATSDITVMDFAPTVQRSLQAQDDAIAGYGY